jgi:DNA-binding transcriptional MerR regulator
MNAREMTISALAKASGLSRSTLLYYDRLGLLRSRNRSSAGYRLYSAADVSRLEQICIHRKIGIPLKEIAILLNEPGGSNSAEILLRRLKTLDRTIEEMRNQQRCIIKLLKQESLHRKEIQVISKKRWVEIMQAAGLSEQGMRNWHIQFEKMEPDAHQEFLESLSIDPAEIQEIRKRSRQGIK